MAAPIITITSISKTKISDEPGADQSIVRFTANQTIVGWESRAGGSFPGSGLLVGKGGQLLPAANLFPASNLYPSNYQVVAGIEIQFEIDNEELQQDAQYRINIYALNGAGEWTPYE